MAHTPGPWFAHINQAANQFMIGDENDLILITGPVDNVDNIYLMSAAPELLAILKKCLKDELARRKKLLNKSTAACYADKRILRMREVIAEAEGVK